MKNLFEWNHELVYNELLDSYQNDFQKHESELREIKKAKKALQKRYDKLLQENKKLKEENDSLQEEMDARYAWIDDADREPSVVRHLLGYCIDYVSNIENVQDAHVECIKDMLESLLDDSSDVNNMSESDRLVLTKKLHSIKKNRKQMKQKLDKAMKAEEKATVNNYYGSIGIKSDRAEAIYAK